VVDFGGCRFLMPPMPNESKPKGAFMKPVQPDEALAKIVGSAPLPRTELTKKLWEYIKKNHLQHKKTIKADDALQAVFNGKKEVDMFELTRLVNTHIVK
jgi:chromatin remodeling complex protein RSC6